MAERGDEMKKITAVLLIGLLNWVSLTAQDYPKKMTEGEDVYWILTENQFKNAVTKAKELQLAEEKTALLEEKIQQLEAVHTEEQSKSETSLEGYEHYKTLWEESDQKLEETELKVVSLKRSRLVVSIITGLAGFLGGALLVNSLK